MKRKETLKQFKINEQFIKGFGYVNYGKYKLHYLRKYGNRKVNYKHLHGDIKDLEK